MNGYCKKHNRAEDFPLENEFDEWIGFVCPECYPEYSKAEENK